MNLSFKNYFMLSTTLSRMFSCFCLLVFLILPSCSFGGFGAQSGSPALPIYHSIKKGESLLGISGKYQSTPDEVLLLNGLQTIRSLRVGQRLLVGYRYPDEEKPQVVRASIRGSSLPPSKPHSEQMVSFSGGRLAWPLSTPARIVSGFGPRRSAFHDGLDIAAPSGTPILAAHNGIIAYSGSDLGGYGNLLVLKGDDGLISVYAHNRKNLVRKGAKVSSGQKIAELGATGRAEGPHLHFEVRTKDKRGRAVAVDPLPLLKKEADSKPRFRVNESLQPLLAWLE